MAYIGFAKTKNGHKAQARRLISAMLLAVLCALSLAACSGGSGGEIAIDGMFEAGISAGHALWWQVL
jgi:hypothetical protein